MQLFFCRTWKNVLSNGTLCIHILQNYVSKRLQYFFPKLSILFTWWYKSILYNCHWPKSITWLEFFWCCLVDLEWDIIIHIVRSNRNIEIHLKLWLRICISNFTQFCCELWCMHFWQTLLKQILPEMWSTADLPC